MVHILYSDWSFVIAIILELEGQGVVTRTFRRLDPERQQAIVGAIFAEAAEAGPTAISIKQVAERAEVAVGSLYQYFNNREGLLKFATQLSVRLLVDAFSQIRPYLRELPLREALHGYLAGGMEWSQTMQGLIQFYGKAAYQGDPALTETVVRPVAEAMHETTQALLSAAQERGEIRADLELETVSRVVNAWIIALGDSQLFPYLNTYLQVTDEAIPFERSLEVALELLEVGLNPRAGDRPQVAQSSH
jgi:AcrR family transcriptional regulator